MAILQIVKDPDPILRSVSAPVVDFDARLHQLLNDMTQTMKASNAIGIAAVQVGVLQRVCVLDIRGGVLEMVNPEVISYSREKKGDEGCISIPGETVAVRRFHDVTVQFQDRDGIHLRRAFRGIEAVCVQHEIDHMDGILCIDKV